LGFRFDLFRESEKIEAPWPELRMVSADALPFPLEVGIFKDIVEE